MVYESQNKMILSFLKENGSINAKEARALFQCERLSARIKDLRNKGIPIKTEMHKYIGDHGQPVRYAIYKLADTKE